MSENDKDVGINYRVPIIRLTYLALNLALCFFVRIQGIYDAVFSSSTKYKQHQKTFW